MLKKIYNSIFNNIYSNPKLTIFFFIVTSVLSFIIFINNIKINTSTDDLISKKLEFRKKQDELKKYFPILSNNNIIVISGSDKNNVELAFDNFLSEFSKKKEIFSFYFSPQKEEFFKSNVFSLLDDDDKERLINKIYEFQPFLSEINKNTKLKGFNNLLELSVKNNNYNKMINILEKMNQSILSDNSLNWENLFLEQKEYYIIFKLDKNFSQRHFSGFYNFLQKIKSEQENVEISFTGSQILEYEELISVINGSIKASIISFFLVGIILWIAFNNFLIIFSLITSILVGLVITLGAITATLGSLNLISVAFAVLFIGISVDFGIQLCLRFSDNQSNNKNYILHSIKDISKPIIIVGVTSIIGFLSFIPTDYVGLSDLGIVSTIGVIIGLLTNIIFLPCMLISLKALNTNNQSFKINLLLEKIINFLYKSKHLSLSFLVILSLLSFYSFQNVKFDSDPLKLKDQDSQSVKLALKLLEKDPSSDYKISIFFEDINPEIIKKIKSLSTVKSVFSVNDILTNENYTEDISHLKFLLYQKNNKFYSDFSELDRLKKILITIYNDDSNKEKNIFKILSENINNIEKKDFYYLEQLWFGDFNKLNLKIEKILEQQEISLQDIPFYLKERYISDKGFERLEIFPKEKILAENKLEDFVNEVIDVFSGATGMPVVQKFAGDVVVKSFYTAFTITFLSLTIFCYYIFRNFVYLFLSLLPIIISFPLTLNVMMLISMNFNFANMIAIPLIFSLGMSYTIFMLNRYQNFKNLKKLVNSSTPNAVMFSGLTTISSFSSLAFSNHSGTSSMGQLLFISLLITLLSVLVILPLFVKGLEKKLQ